MKTTAAAFFLTIISAIALSVQSRLPAREPGRIVSLAPNITETLYALGLEDDVAGVTRFCTWPPGAREKPEVGGYLDPNLEAIISLEPDLVIMLPAHERLRPFLDQLEIEHLTVPNETIPEIIETIRVIGDRCGVGERAAALADSLESAIGSSCASGGEGMEPRVLIVVDRQQGEVPSEVYAAGKGTWYDEIIEAAGGMNVLTSASPAYPMLSPESMAYLRPELIIEVVPWAEESGLSAEEIASDWESLSLLDAVEDGSLYVLTGRHAAVPGPRFVTLLEEICRILRDAGERKKGRH
jgi:iron complex transport system substrate-binding protein